MTSVPKYPAEDDKLRASSLEKRRGGNVANSLEVLQQLSSSSGRSVDFTLICPLPSPTSQATESVKKSFGPSVDLSLALYREASSEAASSFIIKSIESGSRTIVNYNNLDEMTLQEFQTRITSAPAGQRTWYHFEGRIPETSVACIRWLRMAYPDAVVSVEAEKPAREGLEAMAAEADVVFFSKSWAQASGSDDLRSFLNAQAGIMKKAKLLSCTWGGEGAAVIRPDDGFYHHEPAFVDSQKQVVDTVGAGDTFVAGMLHKLITSDEADVPGALAFANKLAGRKVLQVGFADLA
ncbi:Ketohexokinase [Fulvia fulva]|nr:Ketohexokinase [Fulvia fulva]WPV19202.1 Ketohexokinase [Fulvia fulva]WPV33971.1 Ketohexokinase [Fulvia fulva]